MKILDAALLPPLLLLAGALRRGSQLLATLAHALDPKGGDSAPEEPYMDDSWSGYPGSHGGVLDDSSSGYPAAGFWVEVPPEAGQMVSGRTPRPVPPAERQPLAGSLADRRIREARARSERFDREVSDRMDEVLKGR